MNEHQKEKVKGLIAKGHELIAQKYWAEYDRIVPIRVDDLYGGMEVSAFLEIIEAYEITKDLEECYHVFDKQNHSGWSAGLVARMIYCFHDDGDKIVRRFGFECKDKEKDSANKER